jgi:hypothetical protein
MFAASMTSLDGETWHAQESQVAATLRRLSSERRMTSEDDDVVVRHAIWAALGGGSTASRGIQRAAMVLSGLATELEEISKRLSRLQEEFACLDDGSTAKLFGGPGPLGLCTEAGICAADTAVACALAASEARKSLTSLGLSSSVWVELPDPTAILAAIDRGAEAVGNLSGIAEVISAKRQAAVARAKAAIEANGLRKCAANPPDDPQGVPLHVSLAPWSLWSRTLEEIENGTRHTPQTSVWLGLRDSIEDMLQRLHRHYFHVPSSCDAPAVLDSIFQGLDQLTESLARLLEELSCVDKCDIELDLFISDSPVVVLLSAVSVQEQTVEWKCKFLSASSNTHTKGLSRTACKVPVGPFIEFLEEVVVVGNALDAHIAALAERRDTTVEALKSATETSAWLAMPLQITAGSVGGG